MRRATVAVLAAATMLVAAVSAQAGGGGTGNYEWKASFSSTSPDSQVAAAPGTPTPMTVYLWFVGCNAAPAGAGMAVGEFDVKLTSWTTFGFNPTNGYLNALDATHLLLAVANCPAGPVVAGQWTMFGTSGKMGFIPSTSAGSANTIDCDQTVPALSIWPGEMRLVGCGTSDLAASLQDHGNGCTADPVSPTTWGSVKALYR